MYEKVSTNMDFIAREEQVLELWKEKDIFHKSLHHREGCPCFTFYDGPPTANGKPHIGHVLTRAIKDIIPRYRSMKGYQVLRKAGWDTHGLPVELEVEKQLGINGKPQIEQYGIEPFIAKCKESVWTYKGEWERLSERVGFWADMDNPYITYDNQYIESVWWSLKTIFDKGLLYKGHKVVPYCPRCGTALSSHEVSQGYKDVTDTSAFVRFEVSDRPGEYLLAWTTTPWTLPSNVALCVNPDENYARVRMGEHIYIMAQALVGSVLGETAQLLGTLQGCELEGMAYVPLYPFAKSDEKNCYVVCDHYVTLTDGTGIVHIAPAFGEDDARIGRKYKLPFVQMVNEQGHFISKAGFIAGLFVKQADPVILDDLQERGLLYKKLDYEHSYPYCWRCDTPLMYYARSSWFIQMTAVKDKLLANNRHINWLPEHIKEGRMGNFLENVVDWAISRERYWGTPLPLWICPCGQVHAVGSIAQLRQMGRNVPADIELHKPFIDQIKLICPDCGQDMTRVSEVIDCWYDSGSMPFAQWHYPFENQDRFEQNYPADFISEAIDQTRGWFYTLLAISTLLFDEPAFKTCVVMGHVNDKDGIKMSKHKGNVIDSWEVLGRQGADAVRWYFYSSSAPWLPNRFSHDAVSESQRRFMGTLWNSYAFFVLYANIDAFDPDQHTLNRDALCQMDRWILSRLNTLIAQVDSWLDQTRITEPARALQDFVDELSNWYVRRSRSRFWASGMEADKINAYCTLYTVLETLARLAAPFVPFISESIYQNLCAKRPGMPPSIHLCDYPQSDAGWINPALEAQMQLTLMAVTLGRACRNEANIKTRQPVAAITIQSAQVIDEEFTELIADELNVKSVVMTDDARVYATYRFKPQLRTLGPRYGKLVPHIAAALADMDGNQAMDALQSGGLSFLVDGQEVSLTLEDVLYESAHREGFVAQSEQGVTVVLDTRLNEALIEEGLVREIVSKVQTMRKESGFEVTDHIHLWLDIPAALDDLLNREGDFIAREVQADTVTLQAHAGAKTWNINGHQVGIAMEVCP